MQIVTKNVEETLQVGRILGSLLWEKDCICLNGDLGAGKTHLTKGIAMGMGIESEITSPTFTIVQEYDANIRLFHFDMYRLSGEDELYEMGFSDYLRTDGAMVIEWSEKVLSALPTDRLDITIAYTGEENSRNLQFQAGGKRSKDLLARLKDQMGKL